MLECSNKEIIEDAMIIDEAEKFQEDLIRNNIDNDSPSTCVEHEGENTVKVNISREIT